MRVLVTRAIEDAHRTADALARHGHEIVAAPLSEIRLLETQAPELADVQAILATSSHGVRTFASRCRRRDIRVFAVGASTTATARSCGFTDVSSAEGDSVALAAAIRKSLSPVAGVLLHVAGRPRARGLQQELAKEGYECRIWELYEVVASPKLSDEAIETLKRGAIDAVLVLSPESGRILVEALEAADARMECGRMVACCISNAAAASIRGIEFAAIRVAKSPTLDCVIALLDS